MDDSVAHRFVYDTIRAKIKGNISDRKRILEILRWIVRMPGPHQEDFLKEMVRIGMLKRINRDRYEILRYNTRRSKDFYGNEIKPYSLFGIL